MNPPIRIATRGSALALAQANTILARCQSAFPGKPFEIVVIKTIGDKMQSASLSSGDLPKGMFTKELESALLNGEADLAVHSLKDLPTELPPGLRLGAVTERADVRDVLVYRHVEYVSHAPEGGRPSSSGRRGFKPEMSITSLPFRAVVGTSSTRRAAQLRERRPDLNIVPLRGNVGTRLRKLAEQPELDAIVLASAGLERLGFLFAPGDMMSGTDVPPGLAITRLAVTEMVPCVGQAAIGIEVRENDASTADVCAALNHPATLECVSAERSYLSAMGGGCHLAVAAYAKLDGAGSEIGMQVVSYLGPGVRRAASQAPVGEAVELGRRLAGATKA